MGWRAFKNQVFEQVRHAGFAIALVPRTHEVRDADEDLLLARVGIKQEPKAVVEAVLGNALDGCHVGCNRGRRPGGRVVHLRCRGCRSDAEGKRTEDEGLHLSRDVCSHGKLLLIVPLVDISIMSRAGGFSPGVNAAYPHGPRMSETSYTF
jgi:hypothetical protein